MFEADALDLSILEELEFDGRQSYAMIAKAVGMSEAGVRQRVNRLRDAGFVEIRAIVNPVRLGFKCRAEVGIRVAGNSEDLISDLKKLPNVTNIRVTTGSFDLIVDLLARDEAEAIQLVARTIRAFPSVTASETFFYWSAYSSDSLAERITTHQRTAEHPVPYRHTFA